MSSKLRAAAAMLIEHGKALGRLEQARLTLEHTRALARDGLAADATAHGTAAQFAELEHAASAALARAREIMAELEHPGAVLARRLVTTARAARAAWRGSR